MSGNDDGACGLTEKPPLIILEYKQVGIWPWLTMLNRRLYKDFKKAFKNVYESFEKFLKAAQIP